MLIAGQDDSLPYPIPSEEPSPAGSLGAPPGGHDAGAPQAALDPLLAAFGVRFSCGNSAEIHREGSSGLEAMLAGIRTAKRRIFLETYIARGDATGRRFFRALEERARAGVQVRLLYDAFGARGIARALRPLREAGAEIAVFNALRWLGPRWTIRHRDHRKILVIDGEVGFTGGLNLADECFHGTGSEVGSPAPWRDLQVRIAGPAAGHLEDVFLESWRLATGRDGTDAPLRAEAPPTDSGGALGILADGPRYSGRRLRDATCAALACARRRAVFVPPYFLPGPRLRDAMLEAVKRGVRVDVLLAGFNDHPIVAWTVRALLPPFLEGGVRVFEYERAMMHAKLAVFDDRWAILGTSNLDQQSLHHSYEVNLVARGGRLPAQLAAIAREDIRASRRVTAEVLARRPAWQRVRDRGVSLLVERL